MHWQGYFIESEISLGWKEPQWSLIIEFQPCCCVQGCHPLDQATQSHIQPGICYFTCTIWRHTRSFPSSFFRSEELLGGGRTRRGLAQHQAAQWDAGHRGVVGKSAGDRCLLQILCQNASDFHFCICVFFFPLTLISFCNWSHLQLAWKINVPIKAVRPILPSVRQNTESNANGK